MREGRRKEFFLVNFYLVHALLSELALKFEQTDFTVKSGRVFHP